MITSKHVYYILQIPFQKKLFSFVVFLLSVSLLSSCGEKKEAIVAPEGMSILDLSGYGKPIAIFVPDTAKNPLQVTDDASGALNIICGASYAISVYEQPADLEMKRADIKSDEVNKFTAFIVDEPGAIFWESAITEPEFHFLMNVKIAGQDYSFQDIQDPERKLPGKTAVQKMFDACKNVHELPSKKNS